VLPKILRLGNWLATAALARLLVTLGILLWADGPEVYGTWRMTAAPGNVLVVDRL
jgi:hypothetical protein